MISDEKAIKITFTVLILIAVIGVLVGIFFIVKAIRTAIKNNNGFKIPCVFIIVLTVVIAAISWVMNLGWFRFILTFLPIPLAHTVLFIVFSCFSLKYIKESVLLRRYYIISHITYLFGYLMFPDGGDVGPMYFFFGLIRNNDISDIALTLSLSAFVASIVFLVLQAVETRKIKKQKLNRQYYT